MDSLFGEVHIRIFCLFFFSLSFFVDTSPLLDVCMQKAFPLHGLSFYGVY